MPVGYITGYSELIDVGNNFDPQSGIFTLNMEEEEGIFVFQYQGYKSRTMKGWIQVYKNGEAVQQTLEKDDDNSMLTGIVTLDLHVGDQVVLVNYNNDSIVVTRSDPFTFTGYKI